MYDRKVVAMETHFAGDNTIKMPTVYTILS